MATYPTKGKPDMMKLLWLCAIAVIPLDCAPLDMPEEAAQYQRDISTARCEEWFGHAVAMGWEIEDLPTLDRIMWNESRCDPTAHGGNPEYGDHGLTQVYWRVWAPLVMELGYEREDLYHPAVNLLVARLIADDAESRGWCRWQPWAASGQYGCEVTS